MKVQRLKKLLAILGKKLRYLLSSEPNFLSDFLEPKTK